MPAGIGWTGVFCPLGVTSGQGAPVEGMGCRAVLAAAGKLVRGRSRFGGSPMGLAKIWIHGLHYRTGLMQGWVGMLEAAEILLGPWLAWGFQKV